MDASIKALLPESLVKKLDETVASISRISPERWDEATAYLIGQLKDAAAKRQNHHIFGSKYLADTESHIGVIWGHSAYKIVRQTEHV